MLQFDSDACIRALVQRLIQVMDSLMSEFYRDATQSLSAEGKADSEVIKAIYDQTKEIIETKCKFYADAIMESYGTGLYADTSSDAYWGEYATKDNPLWNKKRWGLPIVGREKGEYVNIYGETVTSTGRNAGKIIEGFDDDDGNTVWLSKPGTHSIQTAEAWIMKNDTETKIERRVKMEVEKFFAEERSKFFVYTG